MALLTRTLSEPFSRWWEIDPRFVPLADLIAVSAPIGMLIFLYQQILRGFHEILIMTLATAVLALTLKVTLAVWLLGNGWGVEGYAVAVIASSAATLGVLAVYCLAYSISAAAPNWGRWTATSAAMATLRYHYAREFHCQRFGGLY